MKNLLMAALVAALSLASHSANALSCPGPSVSNCFVVTTTVDATNNNGDRDPATPGLQVDEGDIVTVTERVQWEGRRYPDPNRASMFPGPHVSPDGTAIGVSWRYSHLSNYFDYSILWSIRRRISNGRDWEYEHRLYIEEDSLQPGSRAESDETIIWPVLTVELRCFSESSERIECDGYGLTTITIVRGDPVTITIRANDGDVADVAPTETPVTPDPENPLTALTAAIARGVGMLAANAVTKRLHTTATANQLNIGRATTAEELLRRSDFNLAGGGFNFWGGGEYVSTKGDHDNIDFDGDTSAFTLGIDTNWRDGLIGVAVSRSDSDMDITVTVPVSAGRSIVDILKGKQETEVTSVHPYLTRRFGKSQLWLTAGHGSGDAKVVDADDAAIKTDITVTTAALGLRRAHGQLTGNLSALYSRAELDAATAFDDDLIDDLILPAVAADSLRVAAAGQAHWTRGAWSPFVDFTVRHDTGIAGDLGGGIEYRAPTVVVRLTTATTIAAESAEENRASLTVRKSSGDFDLGLNLSADGAGIDTARLLTGEWRF